MIKCNTLIFSYILFVMNTKSEIFVKRLHPFNQVVSLHPEFQAFIDMLIQTIPHEGMRPCSRKEIPSRDHPG